MHLIIGNVTLIEGCSMHAESVRKCSQTAQLERPERHRRLKDSAGTGRSKFASARARNRNLKSQDQREEGGGRDAISTSLYSTETDGCEGFRSSPLLCLRPCRDCSSPSPSSQPDGIQIQQATAPSEPDFD